MLKKLLERVFSFELGIKVIFLGGISGAASGGFAFLNFVTNLVRTTTEMWREIFGQEPTAAELFKQHLESLKSLPTTPTPHVSLPPAQELVYGAFVTINQAQLLKLLQENAAAAGESPIGEPLPK